MQALHELNLLRIFDYLSTVSGGGYVGGWWSAWLSRPETMGRPTAFFLRRKRLSPHDWTTIDGDRRAQQVAEGSSPPGTIRYTIYASSPTTLHPAPGSFSADTWRAIAILSRNLFLSWLMLLPLLLTFVIAAQTLFVLNPKAEFLHTHWIELQKQ